MIVIAHNYVHVLEMCDRVNLLRNGRIELDKRTDETSVEELTEIVAAEYRQPPTRPTPRWRPPVEGTQAVARVPAGNRSGAGETPERPRLQAQQGGRCSFHSYHRIVRFARGLGVRDPGEPAQPGRD